MSELAGVSSQAIKISSGIHTKSSKYFDPAINIVSLAVANYVYRLTDQYYGVLYAQAPQRACNAFSPFCTIFNLKQGDETGLLSYLISPVHYPGPNPWVLNVISWSAFYVTGTSLHTLKYIGGATIKLIAKQFFQRKDAPQNPPAPTALPTPSPINNVPSVEKVKNESPICSPAPSPQNSTVEEVFVKDAAPPSPICNNRTVPEAEKTVPEPKIEATEPASNNIKEKPKTPPQTITNKNKNAALQKNECLDEYCQTCRRRALYELNLGGCW